MKKAILWGSLILTLGFTLYPPQAGKTQNVTPVVVDSPELKNLSDSAQTKKDELLKDIKQLDRAPTVKTVVKYKTETKFKDRKIIVRYGSTEFETYPNVDSLGNFVIDLEVLKYQAEKSKK